jgi:hypothetical protein
VRQLLGEARATADRLGQDRNDFWTAFGPTNVALHEVSTAVELGDAGEVVRKGEALDPSRFPPGLLGRRAQVFIDLARGYTQQWKDAAAVNVLLEAERIAPEAVRYQVIVKEMLRELLRREHRASTPQLRPLAARVGILREDVPYPIPAHCRPRDHGDLRPDFGGAGACGPWTVGASATRVHARHY